MVAFARSLFALALFAVANAGFAAPPKTMPPTAQEVDRNPNDYVGKKIAIDVNVFSVGRRDIDVRFENRVKPMNLKFQLALWLADELADAKKSATMSVRIYGSLFAPTDVKGKYVVEVDEIGVLNDRHEVVSTIRIVVANTTSKPVATAPAAVPSAIPAPAPTRATLVTTGPTPTRASVVAPSPTLPTATDAPAPDAALPIVPIAGGLAIAVGGAFAAWMLRKRKPMVQVPPKMAAVPKPPAPPVPNLPMQIDSPNPVPPSAPSVRDRLAQR